MHTFFFLTHEACWPRYSISAIHLIEEYVGTSHPEPKYWNVPPITALIEGQQLLQEEGASFIIPTAKKSQDLDFS